MAHRKNQRIAARLANEAVVLKADKFARDVLPVIAAIRAGGATSYRAVADALNERRVPTARSGKWHAATVGNALRRGGMKPATLAAAALAKP